MDDSKWYSTEELAERLHKTKDTIRKYLRTGRLKGSKNPVSGDWGATEEELRVFMGGITADTLIAEAREETEVIRKAREAAELAELRAREAKAKEQEIAHTSGMPVEEFRAAQNELREKSGNIEKIIEDRVVKGTEEIRAEATESIERSVASIEAHNEKREKYLPALQEAIADRDKYYNIAMARGEQLGIMKDEEDRVATASDYYASHVRRGITYLNTIALWCAPFHKPLSLYLLRQAEKLGTKTEAEHMRAGMAIFKACHRSIIKGVDTFENMDDRLCKYNTTDIFNGLGQMADRLEIIMGIPDDRNSPLEIDEDSDNPSHTPKKEPALLSPQQQSLYDKIKDKVGK